MGKTQRTWISEVVKTVLLEERGGGHVTVGQPCGRWSGNYTKNCRDHTQLGIVSTSKVKNKDDTKMDATPHLHMRLDFNINGRRDF